MDVEELLHRVYEIIEKPENLLNLIRDVAGLMDFRNNGLYYRPPGFYEIRGFDELYVIGDLHGDLDTFREIVEKEDLLNKIVSRDVKIVFLGDYVDRGSYQLELLTMLLLLKKNYPNKIILLRGNHEPTPLLTPYPHDFIEKLYLKYRDLAGPLYSIFIALFNKLPYLARVPGKLLLMHGGPPVRVLISKCFEEAFGVGFPLIDDDVIEQVLWNDPVNHMSVDYSPSPRGAGVLFGERVSETAVKLAGVKYIVRGHEATEGFKLDHGGRVLTLFDAREPYGLSRAGYLYLSNDDDLNDIRRSIRFI